MVFCYFNVTFASYSFPLNEEYYLPLDWFKQFDGIVINGLTVDKAYDKARDSAFEAAIQYKGTEMALQNHYNLIIKTKSFGEKWLKQYPEAYDKFVKDREVLKKIFTDQYVKWLTPFVNAKGLNNSATTNVKKKEVKETSDKNVNNTVAVFNMNSYYNLSGPGLKQFEGIDIDSQNVQQAINLASEKSSKEIRNRIGQDNVIKHRNLIYKLDNDKSLTNDEYAQFNTDKIIIHDIFKKNYQDAIAPFAEKAGAKFVINDNEYYARKVAFNPDSYIGIYRPKNNNHIDYDHQMLIVSNDGSNVLFRYYEDNDGRYPWLMGTMTRTEFTEATQFGLYKTVKMTNYGGKQSYVLDLEFGDKMIVCSVKRVGPEADYKEERIIYTDDLKLYLK